ncbi:MAG: DUF2892 domain-containing protein [Chthoniobacter sp.]|uniref:YgaP family membrane protein n=1 Tax=Chthoniobacter sp. TaxID=2510640 RepID=UPI0032AD0CED
MKTESIVFTVAGSLILTSLALAHWVDQRWLLLTVFVGLNLFQSGFTGFCPLQRILLKFGVPKGGCCTGDARKN